MNSRPAHTHRLQKSHRLIVRNGTMSVDWRDRKIQPEESVTRLDVATAEETKPLPAPKPSRWNCCSRS